ncbi:MAG: rhomboid family intramembrane serine protease [Ruminococcaceae bacterium]|jgi:membrane associated rhomboid family serine protease|nr:rhomboid family intramembrane serine protease [Oscillospiraceae bacterium]
METTPNEKGKFALKKLVIRFNAPVVLTFALLALVVLILDGITDGVSTSRFFCVYHAPLSDPLTYVRFFGHVLGHTSYTHYMGNMLLLLLVGPAVEERYGSRSTLLFILATALVTGVVQYVFFPSTALLGASGVVFMMIVLSSFTEMKKDGIPVTLILVVVFYLGGEIMDGLFSKDNISQITHIVGGLCGLVFGFTQRGRRR